MGTLLTILLFLVFTANILLQLVNMAVTFRFRDVFHPNRIWLFLNLLSSSALIALLLYIIAYRFDTMGWNSVLVWGLLAGFGTYSIFRHYRYGQKVELRRFVESIQS